MRQVNHTQGLSHLYKGPDKSSLPSTKKPSSSHSRTTTMFSPLHLVLFTALLGQTLGAMTQFTQGEKYVKVSSSGRIAVGKDQTQDTEDDDGVWMPSAVSDPNEVSVYLTSVDFLDSQGGIITQETFERDFNLGSPDASYPGVITQSKGMEAETSGAKVSFRAAAVVKPGTLYEGTPMEEAVDDDTVIFDVKFTGDAGCDVCERVKAIQVNLQLKGQEPYRLPLHPEPGTKLVEMGGGVSIVLPGRYVTPSGYPNARSVTVRMDQSSTRPVVHVQAVLPVDGTSGSVDVTWAGRIKLDDPNAQAQENQVLPQDGGQENKDGGGGGASDVRMGAIVLFVVFACLCLVL